MGPRSPEGKAAKKIIDSLDVMDIDEAALAYMIYNSSSILQARLFRVFMHLLKLWAGDYDRAHFTTDNFNTVTEAKRIVEFLGRVGRL